ncbi:hypothetical protein L227DRAFT_572276 [Lentinus tigrinus ALCF2SS1-6]|uniref:Uncharacterized protein n=1 Tax=Lentinus tigrinus ALCF2SS1-6 TaxID=1328759 RepID=A0A5C2SKM4_9APHY|nr:hypothetical protein L227DRAFT_572276 [Lentinus tigrinus ALCF2SS1-6]
MPAAQQPCRSSFIAAAPCTSWDIRLPSSDVRPRIGVEKPLSRATPLTRGASPFSLILSLRPDRAKGCLRQGCPCPAHRLLEALRTAASLREAGETRASGTRLR